jgi:hypothetical protein
MRIDSPHHSECSPPWLQPVEHSFPLSPKALSCTAGGENLYFFAGLPFPERDFPFGLCFTSASWFASACFPWNCSRPLTPHNTKKTLQNSLHIVQLQSVSPCIPLGKKRSPKFCRVSRHTSQAMRHRRFRHGQRHQCRRCRQLRPLGDLGATVLHQGAARSLGHLLSGNATADAIQDWGSGMAKAQATSQNRLASRRFLRTGLTPRSIRTNAETLRSIRSNMINICS